MNEIGESLLTFRIKRFAEKIYLTPSLPTPVNSIGHSAHATFLCMENMRACEKLSFSRFDDWSKRQLLSKTCSVFE